jgi:hypothetical protein
MSDFLKIPKLHGHKSKYGPVRLCDWVHPDSGERMLRVDALYNDDEGPVRHHANDKMITCLGTIGMTVFEEMIEKVERAYEER